MVINASTVKKHKLELGYSKNTDNYIMVEKIGIKSFWLGPLSSKEYIVTFEDDGLLFMGRTAIGTWTDSNYFIPIEELGNIILKKSYFINGRLLFNGYKFNLTRLSDNKEARFICYSNILNDNVSNALKKLSSYPSMAKRQELMKVKREQSSTSNLDELAKLKKLLDDEAITQEEYDAKKKQLLDL